MLVVEAADRPGDGGVGTEANLVRGVVVELEAEAKIGQESCVVGRKVAQPTVLDPQVNRFRDRTVLAANRDGSEESADELQRPSTCGV